MMLPHVVRICSVRNLGCLRYFKQFYPLPSAGKHDFRAALLGIAIAKDGLHPLLRVSADRHQLYLSASGLVGVNAFCDIRFSSNDALSGTKDVTYFIRVESGFCLDTFAHATGD